ncbi:MAG: M23 family metallopeptidase [Acidobacteria bacterium]|nr:MAG: M23 family metallopeptidase [Acidobacteriota bacterium]
MKRGDFTIILARFAETPAKAYCFSRKLATAVTIVSFVLISGFILSSLHYYQMWKKTSEYDRLRVEVDQLRKENQTFRLAANNLTDQLSALEVVSKKVSILSGLNREGLGGVGGPGNSALASLTTRDLTAQLRQLGVKGRNIESELRQWQDFYTSRSILLAATPAIPPVHGYPSAPFGYRLDPFTNVREFHSGIDISAPRGNKVLATADGLAVFAQSQVGYGRLVVVRHRFGLSTRYGHLSQVAVRVGQRVKKGDIIGYVGSTGRATGPHLHYEVRLNGQAMNPLLFYRENY